MIMDLSPDEMRLMARVLKLHLSDLRMEIADTDSYDWRQGLKLDEEMLKGLILRLEQAGVPA